MDGLTLLEEPPQKLPTMIAAFAGWPDAADSATGAVRHLVDNLSATRFTEIDPEEFFDFTDVRPQVRVDEEGEHVIQWPANDFFYYAPEEATRGLLLFIGTEPSLRWRAFSKLMLHVADLCGVELVVSLGALLDEVPHTREPSITGRATSPELEQKVEWLGIRSSGYQGPTGIHTAFMDACMRRGMSLASIWGHSPHHVSTTPNLKVTHALLVKARGLVEFDVPMDDLRRSGEEYVREVDRAIAKQPHVTAYVKKLEQYLQSQQPPPDQGRDT